MGDNKYLKQKIMDSGIAISVIARKTGISRETIYNKLSGKTEWKASEIAALTRILHLGEKERNKIFFAESSELNSTKNQSD